MLRSHSQAEIGRMGIDVVLTAVPFPETSIEFPGMLLGLTMVGSDQ
jgi:hypothetical protein